MKRRVAFWIAVSMLVASGVCSGSSTLAYYIADWNGTWASYNGQTPTPFLLLLHAYSGYANAVFHPSSLIALAVYLVFVERERRLPRGRGFELEPTPTRDGT
jgi:hypothetical protein